MKRWLLLAACVGLGACSATGGGEGTGDSGAANAGGSAGASQGGSLGAGGGGAASPGGASSGGSATGGSLGFGGSGAGQGGTINVGGAAGSGGQVGAVYAHSATTLYKLDPYTKQITIVGKFDCLGTLFPGGGMWDIAIDKNGNMVGTANNGVSTGGVVSIDKTTAHCSVLQVGTYPNSLTFVPAGTLLPNTEALVGYNQDQYVEIDEQTGTVTTIGDLNPNPTGQDWQSSGDIVSIIGGGTYVTVNPYGSTGGKDSIVEVDPKTGQVTKLIGNTGFTKLWGLGYWGGIAYGFSATGQLAQIDLSTGVGTSIPLQNVPAGLAFWGAGTTTAAPIHLQ
jgi:hypothetical protein